MMQHPDKEQDKKINESQKSQKKLDPKMQKKQNQFIKTILTGDFEKVKKLHQEGALLTEEGDKPSLYPLVAAAYSANPEIFYYIENEILKIERKVDSYYQQIDLNKLKLIIKEIIPRKTKQSCSKNIWWTRHVEISKGRYLTDLNGWIFNKDIDFTSDDFSAFWYQAEVEVDRFDHPKEGYVTYGYETREWSLPEESSRYMLNLCKQLFMLPSYIIKKKTAICSNRGFEFYSKGEYSSAVDYYDKAELEARACLDNKFYLETLIDKAYANFFVKKFDQAEICFQDALNIDKSCQLALQGKVLLAYQKGLWILAIDPIHSMHHGFYQIVKKNNEQCTVYIFHYIKTTFVLIKFYHFNINFNKILTIEETSIAGLKEESLLSFAAQYFPADIVQELLKIGIKPESSDKINAFLMYYAYHRKIEHSVIEWLVQRTSFHECSKTQAKVIIDLLIIALHKNKNFNHILQKLATQSNSVLENFRNEKYFARDLIFRVKQAFVSHNNFLYYFNIIKSAHIGAVTEVPFSTKELLDFFNYCINKGLYIWYHHHQMQQYFDIHFPEDKHDSDTLITAITDFLQAPFFNKEDIEKTLNQENNFNVSKEGNFNRVKTLESVGKEYKETQDKKDLWETEYVALKKAQESVERKLTQLETKLKQETALDQAAIEDLRVEIEALQDEDGRIKESIEQVKSILDPIEAYWQEKQVILNEQKTLLSGSPQVKMFYQTFLTQLTGTLQSLFQISIKLGLIEAKTGKILKLSKLASNTDSALHNAEVLFNGAEAIHGAIEKIAELDISAVGNAMHYLAKFGEYAASLGETALSMTQTVVGAAKMASDVPVIGIAFKLLNKGVKYKIGRCEKNKLKKAENFFLGTTPKTLEKQSDAIARKIAFAFTGTLNQLDIKAAEQLAHYAVKAIAALLLNQKIGNRYDLPLEILFALRAYPIETPLFKIPFIHKNLLTQEGKDSGVTASDIYCRSIIRYQHDDGTVFDYSGSNHINYYMHVDESDWEILAEELEVLGKKSTYSHAQSKPEPQLPQSPQASNSNNQIEDVSTRGAEKQTSIQENKEYKEKIETLESKLAFQASKLESLEKENNSLKKDMEVAKRKIKTLENILIAQSEASTKVYSSQSKENPLEVKIDRLLGAISNQGREIEKNIKPDWKTVFDKASSSYHKGIGFFHAKNTVQATKSFGKAKEKYKEVLKNNEIDQETRIKIEKRLTKLKIPNGKYCSSKLTK